MDVISGIKINMHQVNFLSSFNVTEDYCQQEMCRAFQWYLNVATQLASIPVF